MRLIFTALIFCLLAGSFQSCVSKKKYDELVASKEATDQALAETQTQVKNLQQEKDQLQTEYNAEKTRLNNEIQSVRNDMNTQMAEVNKRLQMTQSELDALKKEINDMFDAYDATGLSLEERDGELYVVTETPFKFRTGSASLTSAERNAIDALATKMKGNTNLKIMVEGHADNQKYPSGSSYDNWDLSFARAKAVAARLIRQGVNPEQIVLAGRGEYDPMEDNGTTEGRAANRRTVIKPNPSMAPFIQAVKEEGDMNENNNDN